MSLWENPVKFPILCCSSPFTMENKVFKVLSFFLFFRYEYTYIYKTIFILTLFDTTTASVSTRIIQMKLSLKNSVNLYLIFNA